MRRIFRRFMAAAAVLSVATMSPAAAAAQDSPPPPHSQVISANPFGLLLEFFNAEYERVVSSSSTFGLGGSFLSSDEDDYFNLDLFYRFYPSARPIDGWAFGAKVGVTRVPDIGTYPGLGFDVNRSWLLGERQNFYVGLGVGLKRLLGTGSDDVGLRFIPTIRIINIGIAF